MEKTLEVHLQEERERIARKIEEELLFFLRHNRARDFNAVEVVAIAEARARVAHRIRKNFELNSESFISNR